MTMDERPILIVSGASERTGQWYSRLYTRRERTTRAAKVWSLSWLGAIITIFIPIAHFFLVPACLIAGPVLAYQRYRGEEVPDHVSGDCPAHQQAFTLALDTNSHLPLWTYCPQCRAPLQFTSMPT
jgi:hypothetical protein